MSCVLNKVVAHKEGIDLGLRARVMVKVRVRSGLVS